MGVTERHPVAVFGQHGVQVVYTPELVAKLCLAHLDDESRLSGIAALAPTLVRWSPPC